ncbi:protein kinase family protein [Cedecea davisae]|uniref:OspG family effector kinase n=1 Tax=Cedecea davisae TaxID=158484 RepID=UPI00242EC4B8|nr:protein kinase family protein [Cedecea davisae]
MADGQLTAVEAEDFEFLLRTEAADNPVLITSLQEMPRTRRALLQELNPQTGEHIKAHCAFEEEVMDVEGKSAGKLLLLQAQRAENPFRMIYDSKNREPSTVEKGFANALNFVTNIMTLGVKPFITNIIAAEKRRQYYENKGDDICSERHRRILVAETFTSVDATGHVFPSKLSKPKLLIQSESPKNAAFYLKQPQAGTRKEIILELKQGDGGINNIEHPVYLKPTGEPNEFITHHSDGTVPQHQERKVIVSDQKLSWRYADDLTAKELDVDVREGKKQIKLYDEYYELTGVEAGKYKVLIRNKMGLRIYIPVYMEPLSKAWHVNVVNGRRAFNIKQEKIINEISAKRNDNFEYACESNNNENYYGLGRIYRAIKPGADYSRGSGKYVEMNGHLVPVREIVTAKHGVHYEVYDIKNINKKGWLLEWDGARWLFERHTSVHVSRGLKNKITSQSHIKNIDASMLSAPDRYGLRWDGLDNSYIKIKNNHFKIKKLNKNRFSLSTSTDGHRTILRFKKNKFHIESAGERLKNIKNEGLGGKKRKSAMAVLKDLDGFTPDSAKKLLSQYQFPANGFYNKYSFALEIEQTNQIPAWASRFKKRPRIQHDETEITGSVVLMKPDFQQHEVKFNFGKRLGGGEIGDVYIDADDPSYLIKRYYDEVVDEHSDIARQETETFKRYYGDDSALLLIDEDGDQYVRMYRVPGQTLESLPAGSLPHDAEEKFVDMIERLNSVGIIHDDLHMQNILWDDKSQSFFPIDMSNIKPIYFDVSVAKKDTFNKFSEDDWNSVLEEIRRKKA